MAQLMVSVLPSFRSSQDISLYFLTQTCCRGKTGFACIPMVKWHDEEIQIHIVQDQVILLDCTVYTELLYYNLISKKKKKGKTNKPNQRNNMPLHHRSTFMCLQFQCHTHYRSGYAKWHQNTSSTGSATIKFAWAPKGCIEVSK